jgi:hypothetical protein
MWEDQIQRKEHNAMKLRFFYGLKPKLTQKDADTFSGKGYKCDLLLQNRAGHPVAVSYHKELDIWKVQHGFSTVVFGTYGEAMAYCKGRFFDLDGRSV